MRHITILFTILWSLSLLHTYGQKPLYFHEGEFKIAQLTDIHWTPKSDNCAETRRIILNVLTSERPDLVILTGDIVTEKPAQKGWEDIIAIMEEAEIPFIVTMGNHDAEVYPKEQIYARLLRSPYYIGERGPEDITGYGNCVVPILSSDDKHTPAALLYCLDSNDYPTNNLLGEYDRIHFDQVAWYRSRSRHYTDANGGEPLPALAFFHIPLPEFRELKGDPKTYGLDNEGVAAAEINSGIMGSFLDMGDVMGVFAGHDHANDYIGITRGVALGYGRVSGLDGYSSLPRGARIIRLYEGERKFDTHITTPEGAEAVYYYPSGINSQDEKEMKILPALSMNKGANGTAYTYYEGKCKSVADIPVCRKIREGTLPNISISGATADDYFAYEFRALLDIPEDGVYRFYTRSDDGSVLYLDGQLVVDNDGGHSARRAEGKVRLQKGLHLLRLLYFESYMGQELKVGIIGRNLPETLIPKEMLFLPPGESR